MKSFAERNLFAIGATGLALSIGAAAIALQYDRLPFFNNDRHYSAYFAEAGGLRAGAVVQVAGYRVGKVKSVDLDGDRVLVDFDVEKSIPLGALTEANIRTKSLLGAKVLQVTPRGDGTLSAAIPLERTRAPYQLPDALGDLSTTINGLDTRSVSDALSTLAATFKDTPPALKEAVAGVSRFSQSLGDRDAKLRTLLENANKATTVLGERADQVAKLVANTNSLLVQLESQSAALNQIAGNLSAFAQQLGLFISDNKTQLRPDLEKLNGILAMVDNRKDRLVQAIKYLNSFTLGLGEAIGSGPFFKAYLANVPSPWAQPFIDAAFSDLGLDPQTLLPSQRTDPAVGQPAMPALPIPYPRTGQGGTPAETVQDAITGNPGDQPCGLPGMPVPGTGCYPYSEPLPAPPPGGPQPGPPALPTVSAPTPTRIYHPAPGEPDAEGGN